MYAIIETGGKQYRVQEGDFLEVEKLGDEVPKDVSFNKVLFLFDGANAQVGAPYLNCTIHAEFVGEVKGPKVISFKYKRRKRYARTVGHRQRYSRVRITKIAVG